MHEYYNNYSCHDTNNISNAYAILKFYCNDITVFYRGSSLHKLYCECHKRHAYYIYRKMKTILTIASITYLFVGLSQAQTPQADHEPRAAECTTQLNQLSMHNCISRLRTAAVGSDIDEKSFCNECGSNLISYYQDCGSVFAGIGESIIESVQHSKLISMHA